MDFPGVLSREKRIIDKKSNKFSKGFTLVELIVVLVIVGILAAVAVPTFLAFMDFGREKGYRNNAAKSLAATQSALSEIYTDAGSALTPDMRQAVKELVFADDDELKNSKDRSGFIVWTEKKLHDGQTTAVLENIGSYTIGKALYYQDGTWFAYNGEKWDKFEEKDKALQSLGYNESEENIIYVWPYNKRDFAYLDDDNPPDVNDPDTVETNMKIVTFKLDVTKLDKIYFAQEGRNDNSGKISLDILFWKNGTDAIESYWKVVNGVDLFTINDYYTYRIASAGDVQINKTTWNETSTGNSFDTIAEIQNYIFSEAAGNKSKESFEFVASFDTNDIVKPQRATISKSAFASVFTGRITDMTQVDFEDRPANAVKVDDGTTEGQIFAWKNNNEVCWCTDANSVYMPADCSSFFAGNTGLERFDFSGFVVYEVTTTENMFSGATNLKEVYLSPSFNAGVLTNVKNMFNGCEKLSTFDSQNLATGVLNEASGLFRGCKSLKTISFPAEFNTGNVHDFSYMFSGCENLTQVETGGFNTSNQANYEYMFEGCKKLKNIDVNSWTGVTPSSMRGMFSGCEEVEDLDIHAWDTSNLTSLEDTFNGCVKLKELNMSGCSLENVTSLNGTFRNLTSLERLEVGNWDLKNCTDMTETFAGCVNLRTLDVSKIKTTNKLTSLKGTFKNCAKLRNISVVNWNTSNVGSFSELFCNCSALENIIGIEKLDTSSANDLSYMFAYADSVKALSLKSFNTGNVGNFEGMFYCNSTRNNLKTIYVSSKFVIKDECKGQDMFKNNNRLVGGAGTVFDPAYTKADRAVIDGYKKKVGYFTGVLSDVYIKKDLFKSLFTEKDASGKYILINGVENVPSNSYTKDQLVSMGATQVDDGKNAEYCAYAWKENGTVKWWSDADRVYLPGDCSGFFNGLNLKTFSFDGFETEKITNMSTMFKENRNLESIDFTEYFVSDNILNLNETFYYCTSLQEMDLSEWNLTKTTNFYRAFSHCENAVFTFPAEMHLDSCTSLQSSFEYCHKINSDFSFLHTGNKVTSTAWMFSGNSQLTQLDLSGINVESLTNMQSMFNGCTGLTGLDLSSWQPSKLTNMQSTFQGCTGLTTLDLSSWQPSKLTNMQSTFQGCTGLTTLNLSTWQLGELTTMNNTFNGCIGLNTLDFSSWNPAKLTNMQSAFDGCTGLTFVNLSGWQCEKLENMQNTFKNCSSLTSVNFTGWKTGNLKNMYATFYKCHSLSTLEMKNFVFAASTGDNDLRETFYECTNLTSLDLTGWDTVHVKNMFRTFENCTSLSTLNISGWTPESVKNMEYTFKNCKSLTTLDMKLWDMQNVTIMHHTFQGDTNLQSIELGSGWNLASLTDMRATFEHCSSLNQDFHEIQTSDALTNISNVFHNCASLTQVDISGFETDNVSSAEAAFNGCELLETIYASKDFNVSKIDNGRAMFDKCYKLVGGNQTSFATEPTNKRTSPKYAVIDNNSQKGYLTQK